MPPLRIVGLCALVVALLLPVPATAERGSGNGPDWAGADARAQGREEHPHQSENGRNADPGPQRFPPPVEPAGDPAPSAAPAAERGGDPVSSHGPAPPATSTPIAPPSAEAARASPAPTDGDGAPPPVLPEPAAPVTQPAADTGDRPGAPAAPAQTVATWAPPTPPTVPHDAGVPAQRAIAAPMVAAPGPAIPLVLPAASPLLADFVPRLPIERGVALPIEPAGPATQVVQGGNSYPVAGPGWGWAVPLVLVAGLGIVLSARRTGEQVQVPRSHAPPRAGAPAILLLGQEAIAHGEMAAALAWFETAVALEPKLAVAHLCRGLCLVELGRLSEAVHAFERARRSDGDDPAARHQLARALARLGRERDALAALAPVLAAYPELADAVVEDAAFARLKDHPRFLQMVGRL